MTSFLVLSVTGRAAASTPFTGWSEGAGTAAAALAAGDAPQALAASRAALADITRGEAGARARLLLARSLELDGRPADAAVELASALDALPPRLLPAARARLALDLEKSGRPAEAARAWAASAEGASGADLPFLAGAEARAWLAAGEPREAIRAASGAASADPGARLAQARAWVLLGDARGPSALRALALERTGEPEGEAAADALLAASPGALDASDRIDRARRLVAAGRTARALAELDRLDEPVREAPLPVVLRAVALLLAGKTAEAERLAAPVARLPGTGEPAAARYVLARAAARQGRVDDAVRLFLAVSRERPVVPGLAPGPQADLPDDAAFLAAWLPHDAGRDAEAARGLRRFLRDHPRARRAPDARFFLAWSLLRSGDRAGARSAFRDAAAAETGQVRASALYWLARLEPAAGPAAAGYRAAIDEAPGGWYAILSAARLDQMGLPVPAAEPLPATPPPDPPREAHHAASMALALDLAGAGLPEAASVLLQRLSRAPDARSRALLLAEVAAFAGENEVAYRMARDHLPPGIRAARWAYPDAVPGVLRPAAARLAVDPSLALAAMRRESAFVTTARSGAAAEGLLQLRAPTAHRLASLLGVPGEPDLLDPAENVRLGVAYLGLLLDRFPSAPQALAAYNAGPPAAAGWSRARAGLPLDEWVEEIPYRETRQYVRNVVADWFRYRRLAGAPAPALDPSSPVQPAGDGVAF